MTFTSRSSPLFAASRIAARFASACSACPATSPAANSPVAGSSPSWPAVNEVYARIVPEPFPARSAFAVKDLPKGARVEIEAVATVRLG